MYSAFQEEAALRLTQRTAGASDYRAASVQTQLYSDAQCLFKIPKREFSPVPKCNGMVVNFGLYLPEDRAVADSDAKAFMALVSLCMLDPTHRLIQKKQTIAFQ